MWAYLGTAAVLWGAKKIGDGSIAGWIWFMVGDLLWIIEGIKIFEKSNNSSVIICEVLFFILHVRGLLKWKKSSKK